MLTFATIASNISAILSDVRARIEGIVATIIDLLKQVVNQIYVWFYRFWTYTAENPRGFIQLLANMWVIMS